MQDKTTLERIQLCHPALRVEAREIYDEICLALSGKAICRFAYTLRTYSEQNALYAQGRNTAGKIATQAKGGQSYHCFGMAIDIVLLVDRDGNGTFESASWETNIDFDGDGKSDWQEVVNIFTQHGWSWGGNWKFTDKPHFEKTFGLSVRELDRRFQGKILVPDTNYPKLIT